MSGCWYCGKYAGFCCDHWGKDGPCRREICADHCVPEFTGGTREAWALCKEHEGCREELGGCHCLDVSAKVKKSA